MEVRVRGKRRTRPKPDLDEEGEGGEVPPPPPPQTHTHTHTQHTRLHPPGSVWSFLSGEGGSEVLATLSFTPLLHVFQTWARVYRHLDLIHTPSSSGLESAYVQLGIQLTILCNSIMKILRAHLPPSHVRMVLRECMGYIQAFVCRECVGNIHVQLLLPSECIEELEGVVQEEGGERG
ncbi:hypothetical protein EON63_11885 [archaeon]|nr:MAG: hypothetical protein EON63_11885 [archaeon]